MRKAGSARPRARWALIIALLLLQGCYSLIYQRENAYLDVEGEAEVVQVTYFRLVGYANSHPDGEGSVAGAIVVGIVVWPFDVVYSTFWGILAIPDPDLEIWMGPIGFLGGVLLPGLTLMPPILGTFPYRIDCDRERLLAVVAALRAGRDDEAIKDVIVDLPRNAQEITMKILSRSELEEALSH